MTNFKETIQKLENYSSTINKAILGTAIIEAILVIIIGIVSNNLKANDNKINSIAIWLLIFFGGVYIFLLAIKTIYNKTYPGSLTNELKSERELTTLSKDFERQKTINGFLVTTIEKLNGQTCALNYGDDTHLCDQGIKNGIYNLIEPIIDNVFFVLDTINTKFTIGIYIESYRSMTVDGQWETGIINIDDKLNKTNLLQKDLLSMANVKDEQFHIQTAIRQSFNNYEFVNSKYSVATENYTIICSPMPYACNEDDANGVLFIIGKQIDNIPIETETNLKIFNRVIANWIYRYNECVNNRQANKFQQAIPNEIR